MTTAQSLQILSKNAADIIPKGGLEQKLKVAAKQRRPLVVKFGMDPTSPDLHVGHAVVLRRLRQFQDLGHHVVLIVGDFTAKIGDPSGVSQTRPMLDDNVIKKNANTYRAQATKILDPNPAHLSIRFNGEWLSKLRLDELLKLMAKSTVAQILAREDFAERYKQGKPIGLHEMLYPLMQAYDSVAIKADIELGGTDQTFNLLMGRELQTQLGQDPQVVMTMPLIRGIDGNKKMSKSLGNAIGLTDTAETMYGKVMSLPDALVPEYLTLVSDITEKELEPLLAQLKTGDNPMEVKQRLAYALVEQYHSARAAKSAEVAFRKTFQDREFPADAPKRVIGVPSCTVLALLTDHLHIFLSKSEARRKIQEGAIQVNGEKMQDINAKVSLKPGNTMQLKVGKKQFFLVARQ